MSRGLAVDWDKLFTPTQPLSETVVRGVVMYLCLFVLMRVILRRQSGSVGIADLLVVVLIADASQNALSGSYESLPEGLVLVTTILLCSYVLDWLGYRVPVFQRFFYPPPLPLVKNGKLLRQNMQREFVTYDELMSQLRKQGIESVHEVKAACMEGDGNISVVKKDGNAQDATAGAGSSNPL